jgi:hypothetical protein
LTIEPAELGRIISKAEHDFAQLGRWRRLSRCYEGRAMDDFGRELDLPNGL